MDSSEKKSIKKTNCRQFQMLVSIMQENIQLAKCLPATGSIKISLEEAWKNLARKVNFYGPPERTVTEWKKVWADLKSRTKKKIFENNKNINNCGQSSCPMIYLSELEQSVDKILNFSEEWQMLEELQKDSSYEPEFDHLSKPYEFKTEPDDSAQNITLKCSKQFASKKAKSASQFRLQEKRKYGKTEKQLKLLEDQIKGQKKILKAMQMQARYTKLLAEAASRQAVALEVIAESTKSIALVVKDAAQQFKGN